MISASKRGRFSNGAAALVLVTALFARSPVRAGGFEIEVHGNRHLSNDQIRSLVGVLSPDLEDTRILKSVQSAYIREGYLFARLHLERRADRIVIRIVEGESARFGDVRISGAKRFTAGEVRGILGVEAGQPFKPYVLQARIEDLLARYDGEGFPFAQVWMDSLEMQPTSHTVDLALYVVEGGMKVIDRVEFDGLSKTRPELAVRLSGLKAGEPYEGQKVHDAQLRLSSSGLFDDVAAPDIRLSPQGGVEARIRVVEPSRNNAFSSAFGYADREGQQDRVVSGVVRMDLVNIGGTLRDLGIFWRSDGAGRSETRFRFRQRFFLGHRMSFGLRLEQIGLDTLYTWQSLGVETAAPVGRLHGGLLAVELALSGDRNTFSQGSVTRSLRLRVGGGFTFTVGREGRGTFVELRNRHTYAIKTLDLRTGGDGGSVSQYHVEIHARAATPVGHNVHLAHEIHFMDIESAEGVLPLSEQFNIGGAATLRGYRENQFHGRRVGYTRSELLLGASRQENGYFFADTGYVLLENLVPAGGVARTDRFRFGYGFGLRTRSRAGNIDISFGVGERLSLRQTKVHVILNRTF